MDPIEYTIKSQRIILLSFGLSFLILAVMFVFIDPSSGVWTYLTTLPFIFIFFSCFFVLTFFWWIFSIRQKVLSIFQVNNLIYSGIISGATACLILVLNQTNQLNVTTLILTLTVYSLYQLFSNTR